MMLVKQPASVAKILLSTSISQNFCSSVKYLSRMKTFESPRVAILTGGVGSAAPVERAVATLDHRAARDRVPHTWVETEAWVCGAPRPLSWPDGASVAICQ
ncbi:hypothetical protein E2C01_020094 [Portunus trituberculatus]|uniref:Uncharacterized protein n=1 Tax=Portunus trituberculatus TaxID=210409 RepID=A0A5B7DYX7_PORTR|nr:hypothetical protein [Portunus trituberculatus]